MKTSFFRGLCFGALLVATTAHAGSFSVKVRGSKGEPVTDTVVALIPLDASTLPPASPALISQRDQEFTTYVTVVQAGALVAFPNDDNVQHHVYSLSKAKKFEFPLYNPGQKESQVFDVSGMVTLGCNIHDWMVAYVIVVPTPYFAKTDETGHLEIGAPAGRYRVEIMHPRLTKTISEEITLADPAPEHREYELALKADRRIRRGLDTKAGGYR